MLQLAAQSLIHHRLDNSSFVAAARVMKFAHVIFYSFFILILIIYFLENF